MVSKVGVAAGGALTALGCFSIVGGFALFVSAFIVGNETIASSEKMATLIFGAIAALFIGVLIGFSGTAILGKSQKDQEALQSSKEAVGVQNFFRKGAKGEGYKVSI